ncbi:hypothetical protein HPB51_022545 [Rhipicephalus microplus]|uniref:CAP-Gly domain-containing protein n=1 Tax=Rhipicephalus microplus TaxID=6941 RepID=A0A9J6DCT2_RHIMP|nr:hypothetical protein HPB51_022545 [Rhipicephalus microplus]
MNDVSGDLMKDEDSATNSDLVLATATPVAGCPTVYIARIQKLFDLVRALTVPGTGCVGSLAIPLNDTGKPDKGHNSVVPRLPSKKKLSVGITRCDPAPWHQDKLRDFCDSESAPLRINDRVVWVSDHGPEYGTVRWLGHLHDTSEDLMVGVEFDNQVGTGTGKYRDRQLFEAQLGHASLIPLLGLLKADDYLGEQAPGAMGASCPSYLDIAQASTNQLTDLNEGEVMENILKEVARAGAECDKLLPREKTTGDCFFGGRASANADSLHSSIFQECEKGDHDKLVMKAPKDLIDLIEKAPIDQLKAAFGEAFTASVNCADYETEGGVLILKQSNFEQDIKDHKHVFVKFYSPWCGQCKAIAPATQISSRQSICFVFNSMHYT